MIKEAYCSYEVSKLLKEKGFDEPIWTCYIEHEISHYDYTSSNSELIDGVISAPTHQLAIAWLREEKNIIVNVWYNGVDWNAEYYNKEDENFYLITCLCDSYEEAVEIALKYCLENLI